MALCKIFRSSTDNLRSNLLKHLNLTSVMRKSSCVSFVSFEMRPKSFLPAASLRASEYPFDGDLMSLQLCRLTGAHCSFYVMDYPAAAAHDQRSSVEGLRLLEALNQEL
jgi:hypothetical protein